MPLPRMWRGTNPLYGWRARFHAAHVTMIFARQQVVPLSSLIADLELLVSATTPDDAVNQVIYLPLR